MTEDLPVEPVLSIEGVSEDPSSPLAILDAERLIYPCSQVQQRFWFEEQLHPGNPRLNVACRWRVDGDLEHSLLETAWRYLIERHAALRTRLGTVNDEPVQIVEPLVPFEIPIVDLRSLGEEKAGEEADRLALDEALNPLDLSVAPLLRVTRVMVRDTHSILMVTSHHTICDAWSFGILAREMGEICAMLERGETVFLPNLPLTYGEFSVAQRGWLAANSFDSEIALVREMFSDFRQFELPTDYPRQPVQTSTSQIASRLLDPSLSSFLSDLARREGCTMFMASVAILMTVLNRYTGETAITIGTQVSGRDDDDVDGIVGCFIDTVALHGDLSGNPTFTELMERIGDSVTQAFDLRRYPLERLIETINPKRDLSRNTLFSINFTFYKAYVKDMKYGGFSLSDMPSRSAGALYDLSFFMVERPSGLRISCEYNTDLFETATVEGIIARFELLLEGIRVDATQRISKLPMLTRTERKHLTIIANQTKAPYPEDRTLIDLIFDRVRQTPDATAVVCDDVQLTYAQLDAASNRLARELMRRQLGFGKRIGVLLNRSLDLVVTLLAILKTGSAYVPLDPNYPAPRLAFIIEDAQLSGIITHSMLNLDVDLRAQLLQLDTDAAAIAIHSGKPLVSNASPTAVAYLIYTSGSTGKPKGVQIEHRSLTNLLCSVATVPGITGTDVLLAVTTVSFDIAALELFLPLISGARLVIAPERTLSDPTALLNLIRRCGATILQATPATWQLLLEAAWSDKTPLKMLCGGEPLSRQLANELLERGDTLWNMYGPTETTIWSSVLRVLPGTDPVRIGPPIANTQFYVLDTNGELVAPGIPGELFIGGGGISRGYVGRPDLNNERFVADIFSGVAGARLYRTGDIVRRRGLHEFEFLGRNDQQIKLRGFRIELGEIEATLLHEPDVADAVAAVREDQRAEKVIWAFVVPHKHVNASDDFWKASLRKQLSTTLPNYMLPSTIAVVEALPRTPNGKVDRAALSTLSDTSMRTSLEAPLTSIESALAAVIADMLGRQSVGRHDDIFALGFHSLLAVRLVRRIAKTFGVQLPLRALFDAPTVRELATRIAAVPMPSTEIDPFRPVAMLNINGSRPAFVFLHSDVLADGIYCRRLAAVVGTEQPILAFAPHGTAGLSLQPTVEAMARDYLPRLRGIQRNGPYRLGGFCAGGLVAYELARLLRIDGEEVERLILINASAASNAFVGNAMPLMRAVGLNERLDPRLRESFCYNIARLYEALGEGSPETFAFFRERLRILFTRADRRIRSEVANFEPFEKRSGTRETESYFAHLVAALTFHPKSYDGELTLVWGMDQPTTQDPTLGWGAVAKLVHVVPMEGGHVSPLHDRIEELGTVLSGVLQ